MKNKKFTHILLFVVLMFATIQGSAESLEDAFFKDNFQDKDVCFYMINMDTNKIVYEFNKNRCAKKFDVCSTFKLSLAAIAFDTNFFQSPAQLIKWNGTKHSRKSLNQDQTPIRFLKYSVNWVSDEIIKHLGAKRLKSYLKKFGFNPAAIQSGDNDDDISHGRLKLSAIEQVTLIQRLWKKKLISEDALDKLKKSSQVEISKVKRLYGKTGTGCLEVGCMTKPARQLGWFIGVLEQKSKRLAFAANYSDLKPSEGYAGPKLKSIILRFFKIFFP